MLENLENSVAPEPEKVSFHSNPKERQCQRMLKLPHNCTHLTCRKVMLKILQTRLQQYMNWELPDGQARFRKSRGTSDQIANICSQEKFQKNICFTDYAKNCDYVDRNKRENSWRDGNTRTPYLPPEKSVCKSRSYKLEPDIEQQSGSKSGKEYIKAVHCHPAHLASMQSTSCEMPGWMKHKLESRFPGEIAITSDMQMTQPLWQKLKKN